MVDHTFNRKVLSGIRWATLSRLSMQAITWAVTFVVVRLLTPEDYGQVAMATLLSTYLGLLGEMGFGTALVQRQDSTVRELQAVFGMLILVGAFLAVVAAASAPLIAFYFREDAVILLCALAALQFLLMPFTVIPQARLSIDLRFRDIGLIALGSTVAGAAITLLLAILHFGPYALVIGSLSSAVAKAVALNIKAPSLMKPIFDWSSIRGFAGFSGYVIGERSIWYWYGQADALIVGSWLGAVPLGMFSIAKQIASIPLDRFAEVMNMIALPAFSAAKGNMDVVRSGYLKALRFGALIAFPAFTGIAVVAPDLVPVLLGEKWRSATVVLQLLCFAMPLRVISSMAAPVVMAIGRPDVSLKCVLWAATCVPLAMLFGVRWGLTGVALAWACAYPVAFLAGTWHVSKAMGMTLPSILRTLLAPLLASIGMVLVILMLNNLLLRGGSPVWRLALNVLCGVALYAVLLSIIARSAVTEVVSFLRLVVNRRSGLQ